MSIALLNPNQKLRQAVDLIIVATGELRYLGAKLLEPLGVFRHVHMTGFDLGRLSVHPDDPVTLRLERDCLGEARKLVALQNPESAISRSPCLPTN
jgi:hypothetical protein